MTLALALGQVSDPSVRRALEQIALAWRPGAVPVVAVLPTVAANGDTVFLTTDNKLHTYNAGAWH